MLLTDIECSFSLIPAHQRGRALSLSGQAPSNKIEKGGSVQNREKNKSPLLPHQAPLKKTAKTECVEGECFFLIRG